MQEVFADGGCAAHRARHGRRVDLDRGHITERVDRKSA
jgi:hypothetical protein